MSSSNSKSMAFRADIQILRGVSVLFVVFFHLGFSWLQSGFLGVDVFFVISGFLMAVLYDDSRKLDFFKRRAIRLLPAYYCTIFFTLVASFLFTSQNETTQVVDQSIFGLIFSSNIGFWTQNSYFSKSEFNPLLHLWSLGVEIQFYLCIPVIYWFIKKYKHSLVLITAFSLTACLVMLTLSTKTAFFMMPFRAWEFMIGYGAALYFTNNGEIRHKKSNHIGTMALIILLLIPFANIDGNSPSILTGHPGLNALGVSVATALVLVFGFSNHIAKSLVGRGLVVIGKYSYSIYLVHFPVIVIYLSSPFSGTILSIKSAIDFVSIATIVFIGSILLHKGVERRKFKINVWAICSICTLGIAAFLVALPQAQNALLSNIERNIHHAFHDRSPYRCGKIFRLANPGEITCQLVESNDKSKKNILFVGNSHADSIKAEFSKAAREVGRGLFFVASNRPLMPGGPGAKDIIGSAIKNNAAMIVMHYSVNAVGADVVDTVAQLAHDQGMDVYMIEPVPVWPEHIPAAMIQSLKEGSAMLSQTKQDYLDSHEGWRQEMANVTSPNFKQIPIVDYFCSPECVYSDEESRPFYFDLTHLTLTGGQRLRELFDRLVVQ